MRNIKYNNNVLWVYMRMICHDMCMICYNFYTQNGVAMKGQPPVFDHLTVIIP